MSFLTMFHVTMACTKHSIHISLKQQNSRQENHSQNKQLLDNKKYITHKWSQCTITPSLITTKKIYNTKKCSNQQ